MNLDEIDLSKLIPVFMRRDLDNLAIADILSTTLQPLAGQIARLSTWDQLSSLNTSDLDALAVELSIFWYDKTLSDEQKRLLIANSDKVYMHLGTKQAVLDVVTDIFGPAYIEEWFEYEGQPHYFRIQIESAASLTAENEAKLMQVLDIVKRKSQWLDGIQSRISQSFPLNLGMSVGIHTLLEIVVNEWQDHTAPAHSYLGAASVTRQQGAEQPELTLN